MDVLTRRQGVYLRAKSSGIVRVSVLALGGAAGDG